MSIREGTQLLYCKWCPDDCRDLTKEERLGCLASGGFIDDAIPYLKAEIEKSLLTDEERLVIINEVANLHLPTLEEAIQENLIRIAQAQLQGILKLLEEK